jgi:hypothetical protein
MEKINVTTSRMGRSWNSYIASIYGILSSCGLWKEELWMLMGMTGMGFHFIVNDKTCPSSTTVYDWSDEHFQMMDRIGVDNDVFTLWIDPKLCTFRHVQNRAIARIKESIEKGFGVSVWAPTTLLEFGIISGFDEEEKVFFVQDCVNDETKPLLFSNLGFSEVPFLSYQIIYGKQEVELERIIRSSLTFGVTEWKSEFLINPHYARGKKAYEFLLHALEKKEYDYFGLSYLISVYDDSKTCLATYLKWISETIKEMSGIEEAGTLISQVSHLFHQLKKLVPFYPPDKIAKKITTAENLNDIIRQDLVGLITECKELENHAMKVIEKNLKYY